jgi:hypothetical protein
MLEVYDPNRTSQCFALISRPVRLLREELQLLHEPGSYVGEVVKVMGKNKVLVKVQPEGKYSSCGTPLQLCGFTNQLVKLSTAMARLISAPSLQVYVLRYVPIHTPSTRSSPTRWTRSYH